MILIVSFRRRGESACDVDVLLSENTTNGQRHDGGGDGDGTVHAARSLQRRSAAHEHQLYAQLRPRDVDRAENDDV